MLLRHGAPSALDRANALGFLRLGLALSVIISHSAQFIGGSPAADPLYRINATSTLGGAAVSGFFVISGFLIAGSFDRRTSLSGYLRARIVRIYPAFIVASLLSLVVAAPLGGAQPADLITDAAGSIRRMLLLQPPTASGVFAAQHYPILNGSLWTIAYEARCYVLLAVLGGLAILSQRRIVLMLAVLDLTVVIAVPPATLIRLVGTVPHADLLIGSGDYAFYYTFAFLVGVVFYLYRDRVRYSAATVLAAAALLVLTFPVPMLAGPAVALFGGYCLFAIGFLGGRTALAQVNARNDISYGTYLYAWPIGKLLLMAYPWLGAASLAFLTAVLATLCGTASWFCLERPLLRRFAATRSRAAKVKTAPALVV